MADQHTGIMIALMLQQQDANNLALKNFDGALPAEDLHLTLFMMGDIADPSMTLDKKNLLDVALKAWAAHHWPVAVKIAGIGIFQGDSDGAGNALILPIDSVELDAMRDDLEEIFESLGINFSEYHSFNPHITLAYLPSTSLAIPSGINIPSDYIFFPQITLAWGDWRTSYDFSAYDNLDSYSDQPIMASQKAANFGAKVGQNIAGRLIRGAGGKFASNGAAPDKPAGNSNKPAASEKKPSKTDEAKAAAKQAIADAKAQDKADSAAEKNTQDLSTAGDTYSAIGLSDDITEMLTTGDSPLDISGVNPKYQQQLIDAGIAEIKIDGTLDFTNSGKSMVKAAVKGDATKAKRAMLTAKSVYDKKVAAAAKKGKGKKKKEFEVQTSALGTTFKVYKQADGKFRWVTFSSTAFKDKDGHYVTQKSLADDVERADQSGNYGPLVWWHTDQPTIEIGTCDYNAMHGPILIESGTFTNEKVAQALASTKKEYGVSIGFKNFIFEPDDTGAFNYIERFERSVLPAEKASNWFTKLFVTSKKESDMKAEKFQGLADLLDGDVEAAMQIVQKAEQTSQQAKEAGATFKEVGATTTQKDDSQVYVAEMSTDELNTHIASQLQTGLQPVLDAIAGLGTQQTQKENSAVTALTAQMTGLAAQVTALTETVKGLTGESTKAFRASQSGTTIVPDELAQTVKQVTPQPDPMDDFMKDLSIIR